LSPDLKTIDQVRALNRFTEPSHQGPIPDLLWSDPVESSGFTPSNRGCGQLWGADISQKFCEQNKVDFIIRAHQLVMEVRFKFELFFWCASGSDLAYFNLGL